MPAGAYRCRTLSVAKRKVAVGCWHPPPLLISLNLCYTLPMEYNVNFTWDEEACVWVAQSDDIPGLVLESGSLDALIERVRFAAPELIELNKTPPIHSFFKSIPDR